MNKELILDYISDYSRKSLFFEKDMRFGGKGWVYEGDPYFDYHIGGYTWRIEDSNANIDKYGFSFYLAYFAFKGHTFCLPSKEKWYDYSKHSEYKITGYLFEKPDFGLVEVTLSGYHDGFDGGHIITKAIEVVNEEVALYIKQETDLKGYWNWGMTDERKKAILENSRKYYLSDNH